MNMKYDPLVTPLTFAEFVQRTLAETNKDLIEFNKDVSDKTPKTFADWNDLFHEWMY